ncbi:MAG TPA: hypothetical protein VJC05_01775 [Candidatus Andersenbacteria bacterium]|nr:hypothetical protein [Candidatus Andersenbacteria bacterium]
MFTILVLDGLKYSLSSKVTVPHRPSDWLSFGKFTSPEEAQTWLKDMGFTRIAYYQHLAYVFGEIWLYQAPSRDHYDPNRLKMQDGQSFEELKVAIMPCPIEPLDLPEKSPLSMEA